VDVFTGPADPGYGMIEPDRGHNPREDLAARAWRSSWSPHLCMSMRGVEKQNSFAVTSAMVGAFPQ
jgi:hypothetical protein